MDRNSLTVAYLSYDGLTDPLGQSQILPYVKGLTKAGFRFTIFSFEKKNKFEELNNIVFEDCKRSNIQWLPLRYHKWPPVLSTVFDIWILWMALKKENRTKNFRIVHCRSYITSLVGLIAKRKLDLKFIFDMRGFWADERVEGGLWNLRNPIYRGIYEFFKKKERRFLEEADHTISLTENAKDEILSWGLKCSPIAVIPTCVDLEFFNPKCIKKIDKDKLRSKLSIKADDYVLLYLGSWGTWYLTEKMLVFFAELKKQKSSLKFLIVSEDKIELKGYTHQNDVIVSPVPHNLVPLCISIADLAICFIKPTFSKKASSATKIGEILAMNIPVVTNEGWGDVGLLLKDKICFSSESFELSQKINSNLRSYCEEKLNLKVAVSSYFALYTKILKAR